MSAFLRLRVPLLRDLYGGVLLGAEVGFEVVDVESVVFGRGVGHAVSRERVVELFPADYRVRFNTCIVFYLKPEIYPA